MPFTRLHDFASLIQVLPGVLADRLQEVEAHPLWTLVLQHHERLVEQLSEQLRHLVDLYVFAPGDLLGCGQRPTAAKDGEPTQQLALRFRQELVAPVERRAQRLVTRRCVSTTAHQKSETIVQTGRELLGAQELQPCGCQFNSEWDAVELTADLRDKRHIRVREAKVGCGRARAVDEKTDRVELPQVVPVRRRSRLW